MAFTVRDFRDLVALLEQHPEWRAELRRLVLTEELLALPQVVRELVDAQQRAEQRLERLEMIVQALAEAQQRTEQRLEQTEQRLERLETTVQALADALLRLEQQIAQLTEAHLRLERRMERVEGSVGDLKGITLEIRYYDRAFAYFARMVRRAHALSGDELHALLDPAIDQGMLSEEGADDVIQADVVVRGRRRDDGSEVYLVVEVSWGVGPGAVERAIRRASLLAQTGVQTLPVVAGEGITDEAAELARAMHAWQVLDGQVISPALHTEE
jgi:hypothetical protein